MKLLFLSICSHSLNGLYRFLNKHFIHYFGRMAAFSVVRNLILLYNNNAYPYKEHEKTLLRRLKGQTRKKRKTK